MSEFIFMLTNQDRTVDNALEVVDRLRGSGLQHIGFKDVGASPERQRDIAVASREAGFTVYLEVVSISREEEANSIDAGVLAGVDYIVGGKFVDDAVARIEGTGIGLMPFPGRVVGHPSVLEGTIDEIAQHAAQIAGLPNVSGVDLLAYRNRDVDVEALIAAVVESTDKPVIVAGSIVREEQIRAVTRAGAWGFTIGSAIFESQLPGEPDVLSQVMTALRTASDAARS